MLFHEDIFFLNLKNPSLVINFWFMRVRIWYVFIRCFKIFQIFNKLVKTWDSDFFCLLFHCIMLHSSQNSRLECNPHLFRLFLLDKLYRSLPCVFYTDGRLGWRATVFSFLVLSCVSLRAELGRDSTLSRFVTFNSISHCL